MISAPILEIKQMTKRMKRLDRTASLPIHSQDEIGVLKQQINDLYHHLLEVIDNLEQQKQENLKIGRYKDRDHYLSVSLDIVDEMNQIVLEILSLSSVQELAGDKEWIQLDQVVEQILDQYKVLAQSRALTIDNQIPAKPIYMDPAILKLVLSNVISNAVKHSDAGGEIQLRLEEEGTHLAVENTSQEMVETAELPMTASRQKKEGGLGLFVVQHLLDHEELAYQFDKTAMGLRFRMELPKEPQE